MAPSFLTAPTCDMVLCYMQIIATLVIPLSSLFSVGLMQFWGSLLTLVVYWKVPCHMDNHSSQWWKKLS